MRSQMFQFCAGLRVWRAVGNTPENSKHHNDSDGRQCVYAQGGADVRHRQEVKGGISARLGPLGLTYIATRWDLALMRCDISSMRPTPYFLGMAHQSMETGMDARGYKYG